VIEMLSKEELKKLHTNQRLLVMELQKRNVDCKIVDLNLELLLASYNGHKEFLLDRDSSITPYAASVIAGDKALSKSLLIENDVSVPKGQAFNPDEINQALIYAQRSGFPLVAKPVFGSHGDDVYMNLENLLDVKLAIDKIQKRPRQFLIEEQFFGKEYRIFVTKDKKCAILHREPAHVIGNGKDTIETLAKKESENRMKETDDNLFPRKNSLCPIQLNEEAKRYLKRSNLDFLYVPQNKEKVYLQATSNVAKGGVCIDYTDIVHPSVIDISYKALKTFPGLPYAGIDFLSKDITKKQEPNDYRILEVNTVPGIHMHMRPGRGKSRDVATYIADLVFPETKIRGK
jgi:cyanophycin synthetase